MTELQQTIAAIAIVVSAVIYLFLRGRRKKSCGGSCDCSGRKQP